MRTVKSTLALVVCLALTLATASRADKNEKELPLSEVPQVVKDAAGKAVEGIQLTEAEVQTKKDGTKVYEVEGKANGKSYEIKISQDGKVLKIEEDDDGDDE